MAPRPNKLCPGPLIIGLYVVLSLLAGAAITAILANRPVDIGLDLLYDLGPQTAPTLILSDGAQTRIVMEQVPDAYQRYHAQVSASALRTMRLELPHPRYFQCVRLYIGTIIPQVFNTIGATRSGTPVRVAKHWQPLLVGGQIVIPSTGYWERGDLPTLAATSGLVLLLFLLAHLLGKFLLTFWFQSISGPLPEIALKPFPVGVFVLIFGLALGIWLIAFACFYPGVIPTDTSDQWRQATTGKMNDWHPAFLALHFWLVQKTFGSIGGFVFCQIVLLALCVAFAYTLLLRAGVHCAVVIFGVAVTILSPRNFMYAVSAWKDTPYTIVLCLFSCLLLLLLLSPPARNRRSLYIGLGLLLALIPLYRHNGLAVFVGMAGILPLMLWPLRRNLALLLAVALSSYLCVKLLLYPALDVQKHPDLTVQAFGATVLLTSLYQEDVPLSAEESAFLGTILARQHIGNPALAIRTWRSFDYKFAKEHHERYMSIVASLAARYPLLLLKSYVSVTDYIYNPIPPKAFQGEMYLTTNAFSKHDTSVLPAQKESIIRWLVHTQKRPWNWIIWRPALALYITLISLIVLVLRHRDIRYSIVYFAVIFNTVSLLLVPGTTTFRYQYPLTFMAAFLLCLCFLPLPERRGDVDKAPVLH